MEYVVSEVYLFFIVEDYLLFREGGFIIFKVFYGGFFNFDLNYCKFCNEIELFKKNIYIRLL